MVTTTERIKYIQHESGIAIRIPPYLRREVSHGDSNAMVQLGMIKKSPVIGHRSQEDTLITNISENIRLRKIAHLAGHLLVDQAEKWGIERFCITVHGSLARGLIRNPSNPDKSDVDIDLIIDDPTISKEERKEVRQKMYESSATLGARIDSYVWNIDEMKRNYGNFARLTLASSAYPLTNRGNLWEEVRWIGIETERFLILHKRLRKKVLTLIDLISHNKLLEAKELIYKDEEQVNDLYEYMEKCGIAQSDNPQELAKNLQSILTNNC